MAHISQRNARVVLISNPLDSVVGLDTWPVHCKMLCNLCNQAEAPSENFVTALYYTEHRCPV